MENNRIGSNQMRENFAGVLSDVEHDDKHFFVMRYRKPVAVLVPIDWYEQAKGLMGSSPPTDAERLDALMRGLTDYRLLLNYDKASECPGTEWHQTLLAEMHRRGLAAEEQS